MNRTSRLLIAVGIGGVTTACGSEGTTPETYAVRDSSGIRIVESTAPAWLTGEEWTLTLEPIQHIGVSSGAPEYQFTTIAGPAQHGGTWRQSDGTVVAADFGSRQLRRYAADGTFLNAWGRRGQGPGEFQNLLVIPYRGDSILAIDIVRYSFFDGAGTPGRLQTVDLREVDNSGERPRAIASTGLQLAFEDGTFLAVRNPALVGSAGECMSMNRTFFHFGAEAQFLDTIGVYPGPDFCFPTPGSGLLSTRPFEPEFVFTAHGMHVYVGSLGSFEVRRVSVQDGSELWIRASHVDQTATEAHRSGFRDMALEGVRANNMDAAAAERALLEVEYPASVPAYSQLMVDSEGYLWVRHYNVRYAPGPETWSVFAPEGHLLGVVQTPEDLQVRQIGRDFVHGIWTDEFDVRYVRTYGLTRG